LLAVGLGLPYFSPKILLKYSFQPRQRALKRQDPLSDEQTLSIEILVVEISREVMSPKVRALQELFALDKLLISSLNPLTTISSTVSFVVKDILFS
jgi:hypothetical protein